MRAIAKCIGIIRTAPKIPGVVRSAIERFKNEILDTKDAVSEISDFAKFGASVKKCVAGKKQKPYECYTHVHGPITATPPKKK